MCFDVGRSVLSEWDLQGVGMTCQRFRGKTISSP